MKLKLAPLLLVSLIALSACGKKIEKSPTKLVDVKTYFVKGDPGSLIEGSTKNKTSFLTRLNIESFNSFELNSMVIFTEKEEIIKEKDINKVPTGSTAPEPREVTTENLETGNEAESGNRLENEPTFFNFRSEGRNYLYENPSSPISFRFVPKSGTLELQDMLMGGYTYPVSILHYSLKNDRSSFSILIKIQDIIGKNLIAMTFTRKSLQTIDLTDTMYRYIAGPGVKVKWTSETPVRLDVCGNISQKTFMAYKTGILLWKDALRGLLQVDGGLLATYPPFSDLNTHCIYLVKHYLTQQSPAIMNTASTVSTIDRFKGRFVDSDIIVWAGEIEKTGKSPDELFSLSKVIGHEFGHFLGLDHQFDDKIPSLMSYDDIMEVTQYDRDAIRELYQN